MFFLLSGIGHRPNSRRWHRSAPTFGAGGRVEAEDDGVTAAVVARLWLVAGARAAGVCVREVDRV